MARVAVWPFCSDSSKSEFRARNGFVSGFVCFMESSSSDGKKSLPYTSYVPVAAACQSGEEVAFVRHCLATFQRGRSFFRQDVCNTTALLPEGSNCTQDGDLSTVCVCIHGTLGLSEKSGYIKTSQDSRSDRRVL